MFKILDGLARAAVGVALLPVELAIDLTLPGVLNEGELATPKRVAQIRRAIEDATRK